MRLSAFGSELHNGIIIMPLCFSEDTAQNEVLFGANYLFQVFGIVAFMNIDKNDIS